MKRFYFLLATMILWLGATAQNINAKLICESGDGKTVKLLWFLQSWDNNLQSFDIKRKMNGKGKWEMLNKTPIVPALGLNKNLENVEPDVAEQQRLKEKLQTLIADKKTKEISADVYADKLKTDPKAIQGVAFTIALDYDLALLNGFGVVDRSAEDGNSYEYGLFLSTSKEPVSTCSWKYGAKANLDEVATNFSSDIMIKPFNILLKWNANAEKLKTTQAAGFNVYKKNGIEWTKLNATPVNAPATIDYVFADKTAVNRNNAVTYAIALVSIFGNEGNKTEHIYDPSLHPEEHKAAELGEIKSAGENFKDGFAISWTFPQEYEKYIKGFVIEKNNMPEGYKEVTAVLPANARSYSEKTFSPPASYVSFRVYALYNDAAKIKGNEQLFYYLPVIYAPQPKNVAGKWVKENGKTYIDLTWDKQAKNDTLTDGFQLYASNRFDNKMYWENSVPLIEQSTYRYEVFNNNATQYKFIIAAVSKYKAVGAFSDTVVVQTPTASLPKPVIYPYTVDSAKVTLNWTYPDVADLKGFRVYQNGNLVASEFQLQKGINKFLSPQLQIGATYKFAIRAVTEGGVESDLSIQREVFIQ